jgi:UDP-2,3-diacylglucosamine pyrophosphatase LpxH
MTFSALDTATVHDAIILSDLHLGSDNCQAKQICSFLELIETGCLTTRRLILNGDVFESIDFRRLRKSHWKVLSLIRKLSDKIDIVWLCGNHDGTAEIISHLLGTSVEDETILHSGDQRILILHGHQFDEFLDAHPWISLVGDAIYYILLRVDSSHRIARWAKHSSKTFLRCAEKIREQSSNYALRKHCTAVCCGHTHHATFDHGPDIRYFNSGCWTELPCTYLTVADGRIKLHSYHEEMSTLEAQSADWAETPDTAVAVPALPGEPTG